MLPLDSCFFDTVQVIQLLFMTYFIFQYTILILSFFYFSIPWRSTSLVCFVYEGLRLQLKGSSMPTSNYDKYLQENVRFPINMSATNTSYFIRTVGVSCSVNVAGKFEIVQTLYFLIQCWHNVETVVSSSCWQWLFVLCRSFFLQPFRITFAPGTITNGTSL